MFNYKICALVIALYKIAIRYISLVSFRSTIVLSMHYQMRFVYKFSSLHFYRFFSALFFYFICVVLFFLFVSIQRFFFCFNSTLVFLLASLLSHGYCWFYKFQRYFLFFIAAKYVNFRWAYSGLLHTANQNTYSIYTLCSCALWLYVFDFELSFPLINNFAHENQPVIKKASQFATIWKSKNVSVRHKVAAICQ